MHDIGGRGMAWFGFLSRNVFINPGAAYNLRLEEGGPVEDDVNATYNHWGSRDAKVVSRQIYDAQYDVRLRKVCP